MGEARSCVDHACRIASQTQSELHLVNVQTLSVGDSAAGDEARRVSLQRLADLIRPDDELKLNTEKHVVRGVPHRAIVDYATGNRAELIIMGTQQRRGLSHLALGSVAKRVLRDTPCPVQILPNLTGEENAPTDDDDDAFQPVTTETPATDLIARAKRLRATDIHLDPFNQNESRVRLRIDGVLEVYCNLDERVSDHIVNQWKMMAGVDITDPFHPLEGRVVFPPTATELADTEARLTTAPVAGGEAVAMRLLSHDDIYMPIQNLGFSESAQPAVDSMLSHSEGLVLVTGPTGSGKSTTVYSMLETLSTSRLNIVSIEDPVEFSVPFVRQMQVDEHHGISMTDGIKTMLRMDPDVVFIGEIRDGIAAEIGMRAASSGRYVLSTLHTRDVPSVITVLRDLGLPDRSLAANISGIINQRLLRRLCVDCRRQVEVSPEIRELFERRNVPAPDSIYARVGCDKCRDTGYAGRAGVFEAVHLSPKAKAAISTGVSEADLRNLLVEEGMVCLDSEALSKVANGTCDLDEMNRVRGLL